ncbi:endonuclease [uncultured Dokdonia sp.]|uniref:endonuclease n=1 Tax=uncultured Dokdonia sp. TaxID=575653 RepID=UPI0026019826|nr:endonuclease [uncultured Dokdonia sp.]
MKRYSSLLLLLLPFISIAQQSYYDDTAVYLTGTELLQELRLKLSVYNENYTYGDFRDTTKITDANPEDDSEVLLIYGFNDNDGNCTTDITRSNDEFGGDNCEYNREHTFPRSLANPAMGSASNSSNGIVADPHNLRPSDVQRNGNRGSKKFNDGTGNSGDVGSGDWYPGDEWKGDVARAMMYMYVRYGEQCLPSLVGQGPLQGDTQMLQLFLEWNVEDPVSDVEMQRNDPLEAEYGSRNPFIDNPILATNIWGGEPAEDFWGELSAPSSEFIEASIFPNPANTVVQVESNQDITSLKIYNLLGQVLYNETTSNRKRYKTLDVSNLTSGIYILQINDASKRLVIR